MSHKLNLGWLGAVAMGMAMAAVAQDEPADFATQVPLSVSGEGPWYRLDLPLVVQLNARQTDLSDVRVFDAAGDAQAYALARETAQTADSRRLTDVKWFPLYNSMDATEHAPSVRVQSSANGTLVEVQPSSQLEAGEEALRGWLLDASAIKAPLQQLILDWTSERDGFQRFSIEASDDLQHWQSWGEGQVARLTFADERVEQHEVGLPGQSARYLRLLWDTPYSAPTLTSAQLESASSRRLPLPLVWSPALAGSSVKAGEYTWQLPMGLNVERVQVEFEPAQQPGASDLVRASGQQPAMATDEQRFALSPDAERPGCGAERATAAGANGPAVETDRGRARRRSGCSGSDGQVRRARHAIGVPGSRAGALYPGAGKFHGEGR